MPFEGRFIRQNCITIRHFSLVVIVGVKVPLWTYVHMTLEPERLFGQPCPLSGLRILQGPVCCKGSGEGVFLVETRNFQRPAIPGAPFQCALVVLLIV
jgi:hypothetical protein